MEAPDLYKQDNQQDKIEIKSNIWNQYSQETYTWLMDLFDGIEDNDNLPPEIKSLLDEISDLDNFQIKLEADFHGIVCNLKTNSGKKYTIYLGIYDSNYKYWFYNNKLVIGDKSYLFQTKDDESLSILIDPIIKKKSTNTLENKQIVSNIIKQYKPIKSFK